MSAQSSSQAAANTPTPAAASAAAQDTEQGGLGPVEIDAQFDDSDTHSGISSGESTATTSLSPSVFDFTYANGRRYHSGKFQKADYYLPNDEDEQSRLDLYHHIFLMILGGRLYTAPIDRPHRVLDVGTGTGIWAMDFADAHPESEVIGNDVSPIQPSWVPTNLKFEVDDVEEEWTYPDHHFDYIHMRSLSGSILDWKALLKHAYNKLAPGGWIEYQDYGCEGFRHDGTPLRSIPKKERPPVGTWFVSTADAAEKFGRPLPVAKHMESYLKEAGFVDIVVRKEIWPLSAWPKDKALKEIGKWALLGAMESVYPFAVMLLTKDGWTEAEVKKMCDEAVKELTGKGKYYAEAWFVCARKPEDCLPRHFSSYES